MADSTQDKKEEFTVYPSPTPFFFILQIYGIARKVHFFTLLCVWHKSLLLPLLACRLARMACLCFFDATSRPLLLLAACPSRAALYLLITSSSPFPPAFLALCITPPFTHTLISCRLLLLHPSPADTSSSPPASPYPGPTSHCSSACNTASSAL